MTQKQHIINILRNAKDANSKEDFERLADMVLDYVSKAEEKHNAEERPTDIVGFEEKKEKRFKL